jgi:hypothetical protein
MNRKRKTHTHNTEQKRNSWKCLSLFFVVVLDILCAYSTVPDFVITILAFGLPDCEPKI